MLLAQFEKPVYAQRRYFVQEITGLDDVFDFSRRMAQGEAQPRLRDSCAILP